MGKKAKRTALAGYARIERETVLSADNEPPGVGNFRREDFCLPDLTHLFAPETPLTSYELVKDLPLQAVLDRPNAILLYRVLDRFFGRTDLLGASFREPEPARKSGSIVPLTADWGYCFRIAPHLVAEVRSVDRNSRHLVRLWAKSENGIRTRSKETAQKFDKFISDLKKAFESNLHLFDEKAELRNPERRRAAIHSRPSVINIAREKYRAAVHLLDVSAILIETEDASLMGEGVCESLLLGAATLFAVSFEGFLNLIYALLLRDDLSDKRYERLLARSDLDLRVSSLHIFCRGFARQPIPVGSELWDDINQLREFRNDLIHGNVTDEHELHVIPDGLYSFYYAPFRDYRGPSRERRAKERIRRYTADIDQESVRRIRTIVDQSQAAIVAALDPKLQVWARDLLEEEVVLRPSSAQEDGCR
jgi:hypothetical protein